MPRTQHGAAENARLPSGTRTRSVRSPSACYSDGLLVDPAGTFGWVAAGAVVGAGVNIAATLYSKGTEVTAAEVAAAAVSGAVSGALGALAGPLGGTVAKALGSASNGLIAAGAAGLLSGVGSGVGQASANVIDPCHASSPLNAALWGSLGGAAAKGAFPTKNLNSWSQATHFGPRTISGLFGSANARTNLGAMAAASGIGAAVAFPGANPF